MLAALPLAAQPSPESAESTEPAAPAATKPRISCQMRDGIPTTVSQTRRGEVPIIKWTSGEFDASGWSPEKRCELVSQRFETFRANGQLQYLTTGRVAGQPVICAVVSDSSPCTQADVLYTLKKGQDPSATLRRLLNVRRGASGPMSETGPRIYINFNSLLNDRLAAAGNGRTSTVQPVVPRATPASKPASAGRPRGTAVDNGGAAW